MRHACLSGNRVQPGLHSVLRKCSALLSLRARASLGNNLLEDARQTPAGPDSPQKTAPSVHKTMVSRVTPCTSEDPERWQMASAELGFESGHPNCQPSAAPFRRGTQPRKHMVASSG